MSNDYYTAGSFSKYTLARAEALNVQLQLVDDAFSMLPDKLALNRDMQTYAAASGTATALVAALPSTLTALTDGVRIAIKTASDATGASTINVDGLGVRSIKRSDQSAVAASEWLASDVMVLIYAHGAWIIQNETGFAARQATAAAASAVEAAGSADRINLGNFDDDVAAVAADRLLTGADVVLTNADVVLTGADVDLTNADVVLTGADVLLAAASQAAIDTRATALEALSIAGVVRREMVLNATTANITLSGEQTIDGVLTSTSRILVKDQTDKEDNGIYLTASGGWARVADMNAAAEVQGSAVFVAGGTANSGFTFYTGSDVSTLGTDDIVFVASEDYSDLPISNAVAVWIPTPAYTNAGGQGDRTATVRVFAGEGMIQLGASKNLVNGDETADTANAVRFNTIDMTGKRITFDFGEGSSRVVNEVKWEVNATTAFWEVKWQGSRDGSTYFDLTSQFTLGGATTGVHDLSANTSGFRFYSLLGVSGTNPSASRWHEEVKFKIAPDAADGVAFTENPIFPAAFPTAKLISAYLFDEESGDTVKDKWLGYDIDLTGPTNPNATRTLQGVSLKAGLVETPEIEGVREVVALYRTGFDESGGFMISGGSQSGSTVTQDTYTDAETVKVAGCGFGLRTPVSRLNGTAHQAVREFNRGTWMQIHREFNQDYDTILGFGGRHSTTTSRCDTFDLAYVLVFNAALTDAERLQVNGWLRKSAAKRGILFDRNDAQTVTPLTVMFGDSQADGRANFADWPAFEKGTNFAPFTSLICAGSQDKRQRVFSGLTLGVNQKIDSAVPNGGIEESAGIELALAADFAATYDTFNAHPHIIKMGVGGSNLAPSSTGTPTDGGDSYNTAELETAGLFAKLTQHMNRAFGVMVADGLTFDEVKFVSYLGTNDQTDTADAPSIAAYQGYYQDLWDGIKARFSGINAKLVVIRPQDNGSDATATARVRDGIDAFGTANSDVTIIDTDGQAVGDGVHYTPASYGLQAASVISA